MDVKTYNHRYYIKNRGKIIQKVRQWQSANRDKVNAYARKWRRLNRNKRRLIQRRYRERTNYLAKLREKNKSRVHSKRWPLVESLSKKLSERENYTPSQNELTAYVAGFCDGEGHIGLALAKSRKCWATQFTIANTNKDVLEVCRKVLGGTINKRKPQKENWSTTYYLSINSKKAIVEALLKLLPYLTVKRDVAKTMIIYCLSRILNKGFKYTESEKELIARLRSNGGLETVIRGMGEDR
jgi:hypothetical protein